MRNTAGIVFIFVFHFFLTAHLIQAESQWITHDPGERAMVNAAGQVVTAAKRAVRFYDADGNAAATIRLKGNEVVNLPAGGGEVVGITRYHDHSPTTLKPVAFELYDLSGTRQFRLTKPQFTSVIVSPTGNAIVGHDGVEGLAKSTLRFYDASGTESKTITIERFQGGRFSADGSVFVYRTATEGVLAYSADGTPLAHFGAGSLYEMSSDGSVFAIWQDQSLRCYRDGKRIQTIPTDEIVRALAVSPQGDLVGWVGTDRGAVYTLGDTIAQTYLELPNAGENFRSLAISDAQEFIAVGVDSSAGRSVPVEKRHTRGFVRIFDLKGNLRQEEKYSYEVWNAWTPGVRFVDWQQRLAVILRTGIHFIPLPPLEASGR